METVGKVLTWIFSNMLYPILMLGFFASNVIMLMGTFAETRTSTGTFRVGAGAAIPLCVLIYFSAIKTPTLTQYLPESPGWQIVIGVALGVCLVQILRRITTGSDPALAVYAVILSSVICFFLYCFMAGAALAASPLVFATVVAGLADIVIEGVPEDFGNDRAKKTDEKPQESPKDKQPNP